MRILWICQLFPPVIATRSFAAGKLVLALQERGTESSVVSDEPNGAADSSPLWNSIAADVRRIAPRRVSAWGRLRRACAFKFPRKAAWIADAYQAALDLCATARPDAIVSQYAPFEGHVVGYAAARKTRLPWIAFFSDPWPGHVQPRPYYRDPGVAGRILYSFWARAIWRQADAVLFPSVRLRDHMLAHHGPPRKRRCEILRHVAGTEPAPLALPDRFVVLHSGQAGGQSRPVTPFLRGLEMFIERNPSARSRSRVIFSGSLDATEADREIVGRLGDVVEIRGNRPYSESCREMASAAALLLIEAPMAAGVYLPSKFADYVGTTLPVLCLSPAGGEVADLLREIGQMPVSQTDPQAIAGDLEARYAAWANGTLRERFSTAALREKFLPGKVAGDFETFCRRAGGLP